MSSIPQKPSRAQIYGQVQNLRYWGLTNRYVECPTYGRRPRLVAFRFDLSGSARKPERTLLTSWLKNRRRSLVKLGKVDGHAKYTEKRICRAVLGVDCCERTFECRTHNPRFCKALGHHTEKPKIPWVLKAMTLPILDSLIEAAHKYVPSAVRTRPEVKQGES